MQSSLTQRWQEALHNNYGTPPLALVAGSGATVTGEDGQNYLDLLSGIAVNSLGHAHPAIIDAITTQASQLGHTSNLQVHPRTVELAEKIASLVDTDKPVRTFFCNSGAEANEAAFKLARLTGKTRILSADNSFHGRTMGALAVTGQSAKREPFNPMVADVEFYDYTNVQSLIDLVEKDPADIAAIWVEPIQGEGGVVEPDPKLLPVMRELCDKHEILMVVDEVQTGIGRCGSWFAYEHSGIIPDILLLAKGLGGGLPIGACVCIGEKADLFQPGQHGTTFGGNPIVSAAALAVLGEIESAGLLHHVHRLGKLVSADIECLAHDSISHVRGEGALLGIVLKEPIAPAAEKIARDEGFLINAPRPDVIRLAPPLIVSEEQMATFVKALPAILDKARLNS